MNQLGNGYNSKLVGECVLDNRHSDQTHSENTSGAHKRQNKIKIDPWIGLVFFYSQIKCLSEFFLSKKY